jgi:hypothetical protein
VFSLLLFFAFPRIEFIVTQTAIYGVVAGIVYACVRAGLNYVFGRPTVPEPASQTQPEGIDTEAEQIYAG